jgi:hypothetical protein
MNKWLSIHVLAAVLLMFWGCDEAEETDIAHEPPTVNILSPSQDSTVEDTTTIEVDGTDYSGAALDRIVYQIDGVARYTDPNPGTGTPASVWEWSTGEFNDGPHEITVVGYDIDGQSDEDRRTYTISNGVVSGEESATGAVSSGHSGVISTPLGARIRVPAGAVPQDSEGRDATVIFSIEQVTELAFGPPHGQQAASSLYKFGPSGFVFAQPVEITLPLLEGIAPEGYELNLYRINPTTGMPEDFAGTYNILERSISAQTFHLSDWAVGINTSETSNPAAQGCVRVDNQTGDWLFLCVESSSLSNSGWDAPYVPELNWSAMFGPAGSAWPSTGNWWLPQGTYTVCVERQDAFNENDYSYQLREIVVDQPAERIWGSDPIYSASIEEFISVPPGDPIADGQCGCLPEPTVPVGTGDVQVTLTWWNTSEIDLDLWVIEPGGERCYFGNPITATGGELDRDNLCGNYENGRPENIFWESSPSGTYSVLVHWWSDCGNGMSSQDFEVRVISPGYTNTFEMSIQADDTVEVTEFTVGAGAQIMPPLEERPFMQQPAEYPKGAAKPDLSELKAQVRRAGRAIR